MEKTEIVGAMDRHRLVAVVRSKTAERALEIGDGAAKGGVKFVEITFSVPGALEVIAALGKRKDLYVGAGTVLSQEQGRRALAAGARFVVAPTLELDLIPICREAGVPSVIGAATPSEILTAARAGADLVKIFPADCLGGPNFVRQMTGPLPGLRFMVSGGVDRSNVREYASLGVSGIVLGSASLESWLERGQGKLAAEVGHYVKLVEEALGPR